MSNENTNRIFSIVLTLVVGITGYLCGGITEFNDHVSERQMLIDSVDVLNAQVDHYKWNKDYNALMNIKVSEITFDCDRCSDRVRKVQFELDTLKRFDAKLVVPKAVPELE